MKITKKRLAELIREELETQTEKTVDAPEVEEPEQEKEPERTNVKKILNYISGINLNKKDYQQLVRGIVELAPGIQGSKLILTTLYRELPGFLKNPNIK
jgi:hypothetical protein